MPTWLIQAEKVPFVTINTLAGPLQWDVGLFHKARLQHKYLHIANTAIVAHRRGTLRDLGTHDWKSVSCEPSTSALCQHDATLDFFDMRQSTIPYVHTSELTRKYMAPVCTSSNFGRLQTSSTKTYSVSVCDLVRGHVHFVLETHMGQTAMFFKQDTTTVWQVVLLAVTAIYAVTMLSLHLCELVQHEKPDVVKTNTKYALALTHAVLAVGLILTCFSHHNFLVTEEEVLLCYLLYVFVLADTCFIFLRRTTTYRANDDSSKQVNGMVAFLLLVTLRLHSSFQNIFIVVLTMLFGVRMWCKVLQTAYVNMHRNLSTALLPNLSVALDVVVFYFLVTIALSEQGNTEFETQLLLSTVIVTSFNVGLLLAVVIQLRKTPQSW